MSPLSRRSFLAATAALAVSPALDALGAVGGSSEVDVVIVGAGATGIAAARRLAAANRRFALIEAAPRIGGRCATDTKIFGVPYDLGAHWIHNPDGNPLAKAAPAGLDVYPAPRMQTLRVGARAARDSELETYLAAVLRAHRAMADLGKAKVDFPASRLLPKDLLDWQGTIEFITGPFATGKDLNEISAFDMARALDRDSDAFCRQGYGALLAKLAAGLPVQLSTPVDAIYWDNKRLGVDTSKGNILARAAIVTVSTKILSEDKIEFIPPLEKRVLGAAEKLALGSYDHIALDMPGNPLGLQKDDVVFEQTSSTRTAALLANVSGTSLHMVEVAGSFGRELSAKGEAAMVDFAGEWLSSLFGTNVKRAIKRSHATRWNEDEWTLGAMSVAGPGNSDARKVLMESVGGRIWFAGEALHDTQWGTVAGAWESGTRAAEAVLRKFGALNETGEDKPARTKTKRKRRRRGDDG
jgi:monoamine oxidase